MKALLCSLLKYPDGDAGSIRQEKLAQMLQDLGYEVLVVGMGISTAGEVREKNEVSYLSLRRESDSKLDKVLTHLGYWKKLKIVMDSYEPDMVLVDDLGNARMKRLKKYCKKHKINLVHDSVEWYSPEQFKYGKYSYSYREKDRMNRKVIDQNFRVIAISRYLEKYFSDKGIKCVYIPIVIAETDLKGEKKIAEDYVAFTYAGQPGKKDYLDVMMRAFALLNDNNLKKVRLNIVGCTEDQLRVSGLEAEVIDRLRDCCTFYGRVSHNSVLSILEKTDFSLLLRDPEKRYAKAGFPSKMVESLSRSTPLICNLTSDMDKYLRDGINSMIVKGSDAEAMKLTLERALALEVEERKTLQKNAMKCAQDYFLTTKYLPALKNFLEE